MNINNLYKNSPLYRELYCLKTKMDIIFDPVVSKTKEKLIDCFKYPEDTIENSSFFQPLHFWYDFVNVLNREETNTNSFYAIENYETLQISETAKILYKTNNQISYLGITENEFTNIPNDDQTLYLVPLGVFWNLEKHNSGNLNICKKVEFIYDRILHDNEFNSTIWYNKMFHIKSRDTDSEWDVYCYKGFYFYIHVNLSNNVEIEKSKRTWEVQIDKLQSVVSVKFFKMCSTMKTFACAQFTYGENGSPAQIHYGKWENRPIEFTNSLDLDYVQYIDEWDNWFPLVFIHELTHYIHQMYLIYHPEFDELINNNYEEILDSGIYHEQNDIQGNKSSYAETNVKEYLAVISSTFFANDITEKDELYNTEWPYYLHDWPDEDEDGLDLMETIWNLETLQF